VFAADTTVQLQLQPDRADAGLHPGPDASPRHAVTPQDEGVPE